MALALVCDGFFALRIGEKQPIQYVTGLWRLKPDGIGLDLINLAYEPISMTVGQQAIHGTLPGAGHVSLKADGSHSDTFRITGLLHFSSSRSSVADAGSGQNFVLPPGQATEAMDGKFATAQLDVTPAGVTAGRLLSHSGTVPRYAVTAGPEPPELSFQKGAVGKFWHLPPLPGSQKAALRLGEPQEAKGRLVGHFEISGPGLRLEGQYVQEGAKLTLSSSRASLRDLDILGAHELAAFFQGEIAWSLSRRGLELANGHRKMLLIVDP